MARVTRASAAMRGKAKLKATTAAIAIPPRNRRPTRCASLAPASAVVSSSIITPSPQNQKRKRILAKREITPVASPYVKKMARKEALPMAVSSSSITKTDIRRLVESRVLEEKKSNGNHHSSINTRTLSGWCLVDALVHCANASDGILAPLILEHGPPAVYLDYLREQRTEKDKQNKNDSAPISEQYLSFRSLCRTVAGQQLAGAAADTIWRRLIGVVVGTTTTEEDHRGDIPSPLSANLHAFTPRALLSVAGDRGGKGDSAKIIDTEKMRKSAGLSRAKCDCVLAIARCFEGGTLSEDFLMRNQDDAKVRSRLLSIKGLGPWSVDMFMMFRCHRSNILPIGDLAVRNGTQALWKIPNGSKPLCAKKDASVIANAHAPFDPYRSISSYYMYKVADAAKKTKRVKTKKAQKKTSSATKIFEQCPRL